LKYGMTKIIAIIMLLMMPLAAFALDPPLITPLEKNAIAPYSGVLYNSTAVAQTIAQRESLIAQHKLNLEILEERLGAECALAVGNLNADLSACNQRYLNIMTIKDQHIKDLQILALEKPKTGWWFFGGILTGALITIGAVYAAK